MYPKPQSLTNLILSIVTSVKLGLAVTVKGTGLWINKKDLLVKKTIFLVLTCHFFGTRSVYHTTVVGYYNLFVIINLPNNMEQ